MKNRLGSVIWITGLSGAGKTTLANEVIHCFRKKSENALMLDGDQLREVFGVTASSQQNYGRDARLALAMQYSHLCNVLSRQGFIVVIATISLFKEIHAWNRSNLPGYFEVYLKTPLDELRRRDPKNIYQRFDAGDLSNVAGLDLAVDEPYAADWVVDFEAGRSVAAIAKNLINRFNERNKNED